MTFEWTADPTAFDPRSVRPGTVFAKRGFAASVAELCQHHPEPSAHEFAPGTAGDLRHVLVTGGTGMLGTRLVTALARDPDVETITVVARDPERLYEACAAHIGPSANFLWETGKVRKVRADLSIPSGQIALEGAMREATHAFHLAARVSAFEGAEILAAHNFKSARMVATTAMKSGVKLTHASTLSIFVSSDRGGEGLEETIQRDPARTIYGGYAQTKVRAEASIEALADEGLDFRILRFGLIVPELAGYFPEGHFMKTFMRAVADLGSVPEHAEEALVDLTPADQAAEALRAIAESGHRGIFHYANPRSATLTEIVRGIDSYLAEDGGGLEVQRNGPWRAAVRDLRGVARPLLESAFEKTRFVSGVACAGPYFNADLFQSTGRSFGIARSLAAGAPAPKAPRLLVPDLVDAALSDDGKD